jgi:two-component system NtrC family sensor kinase
MNKIKIVKYKSMRSVLVIWCIIFSIIPLVFMGWYSVFKFEHALQNEVAQRLQGNGREIEAIISDYYSLVTQMRDKYGHDANLQYHLSIADAEQLQIIAAEWIQRSAVASISFYDREGRMLATTFRGDKNLIRSFGQSSEKILLNEKYLNSLKNKSDIGFVDSSKEKMSLVLFSKVLSTTGKHIGYFEQMIDLKDIFLSRIKNRLKIESFLLSESGRIISASNDKFKKIKINSKNFNEEQFIEYDDRIQNLGFILYPLSWDRSKFYIGLGAPKQDSQSILKNIRIAFLTVISIVSVFLIITILVTTNWLLKPIQRLIAGFRSFDQTNQLIQLPVSNRTEIGLLTETFNEMSNKIYQTRSDLRKKIKELEQANSELKLTQGKLVHSAKMTSLGQLVAGVAHELNNPIGFIFSNTTHLSDYAKKLFDLIDGIEKNPQKINVLKNQIDYEYIKTDLPKLIKSCQDGAQRTRDIVLGLRNFSRLEEAQLKEIDLREALDTTLELLQGEIKNRLQVHRQYESIPKVHCYASQINQVFMNILSNAVQAIQGPGQIWVTTIPLKASKGQPGRVQVSIQDSGMGMDAATLEKIFEPFFTTKGVGQGTGLGLSISYGIIQNHGGEIQVRSQKGIGTEFIVIIPLTPPNERLNLDRL